MTPYKNRYVCVLKVEPPESLSARKPNQHTSHYQARYVAEVRFLRSLYHNLTSLARTSHKWSTCNLKAPPHSHSLSHTGPHEVHQRKSFFEGSAPRRAAQRAAKPGTRASKTSHLVARATPLRPALHFSLARTSHMVHEVIPLRRA